MQSKIESHKKARQTSTSLGEIANWRGNQTYANALRKCGFATTVERTICRYNEQSLISGLDFDQGKGKMRITSF